MRFRSLSELRRTETQEIVIATLPQHIAITPYARAKAFKINEIVRAVHKESYEWYGYTIAGKDDPTVVVDIGLPKNDRNLVQYTSIEPERIVDYLESLPAGSIINGWIHSHGSLACRDFSAVDDENQITVLDYVVALLRKPVSKKEIAIDDLTMLVKGRFTGEDLEKGSVSIITDSPIREAKILETVYGGFCYSIVIGDGGWHRQKIYYKKRGILSGNTTVSYREAEMVPVDIERPLTRSDVSALLEEVRQKIRPVRANWNDLGNPEKLCSVRQSMSKRPGKAADGPNPGLPIDFMGVVGKK